jgi:predicted dehydrogenase
MISKVLIVGFGSIGKRHLIVAKKLLPKADIRVLTKQTLNEESDNYGIQFSDIKQAINFSPQLTIICNASTSHIETAKIFAELNSHLLIEKPISYTESGIALLIETCDARGLQLEVGYNLRYLDSLQQFKKEIEKGRVGQVITFKCEVGQYLPKWRPNQDYRKTVSARRELGGGVLSELSHELDYLLWILGDVVSIQSSLFQASDLETNVEDLAFLTLEIKSYLSSKLIPGQLTLDFIRHDATRNCTVIGSEGTIKWDGITGNIECWENNSEEWIEIPCKKMRTEETYFLQWESLLERIEKNMSPSSSAEQALRVVQLIESARESSKLGVKVSLESTC